MTFRIKIAGLIPPKRFMKRFRHEQKLAKQISAKLKADAR